MQEWTEQQAELQLAKKGMQVIFFYTPMCGTCQVSKKMLEVAAELVPQLEIGMCNLNYMPKMAERFEIESVPCLIAVENDRIYKKIYAFRSIEYLLGELREIA
ncbi:thioredoxin family protein [Priestia koreensis]|uniref:Thioredoxin n=1 Tax=Priestia koreensis TaxID=284581 RepID=A0A0M0KE31_9BACI|nr:thioredoxin family protein [Priestia koreensis]KOO37100.1 thioredoxin [Priestia koreensis]MCM3004465.1 thioredoxin family protein [Priestia koreensis]UNL84674.1 thioredoxin family protein [Priestia koreensis]